MWRRSSRGLFSLAVRLTAGLAVLLAPTAGPAIAQSSQVSATVETQPVPSSGDAADDPAIWVHPTDPSLSTIIGTDKEGGLAVYDLDGDQIQYISGIRPNNVDLRYDFPLGDQTVDLVVTSDRGDDAVTLHRVDPQTRQLVETGPPIGSGMDVSGICMYRSPTSGDFYVFVTSDQAGPVRQWRLDGSGGQVNATQVRDLDMESVAEGCVADDDLAFLYVSEEDFGIWKFEAEPDAGDARVAVDEVGSNLEADVEGLAVYYGADGAGYLLASSQGSGEYSAYDRDGDNQHITNFQIVDSAQVDGTSSTDGIEVMSAPLGAGFPNGLFVAQDGENDSGNQNFKLVPWELVAGSGLTVITDWNPRGDRPAGISRAPLPSDIATSPSSWSVSRATVQAADHDGALAADGSVEPGDFLVMAAGDEVSLTFSGLDVPAGATLRSAHVQFTAGVAEDSPVVLSIHALVGGAATEVVTWSPAPWGEEGERGAYQQTPDLSAIVREALASPGQSSDAPLVLSITAQGSGQRSAVSFEADPAAAPSLRLEFAEEG
jgi:myo-inositol-hexaphosphate 3-phosphohydrolase